VLTPLAAELGDDGRYLMLHSGDIRLIVVLPQPKVALDTLPAVLDLDGEHGACRVTRLDSGAETIGEWENTEHGYRLSPSIHCMVPTLITLQTS